MLVKIVDIPLSSNKQVFGAIKFYFKLNSPNTKNIELYKQKLKMTNASNVYKALNQGGVLPIKPANFESTIFLHEISEVISGAFKLEYYTFNASSNIYILESIFENSKRRI